VTVTTPRGFRASGVTAGLKPSGNKDLALVVNDGPSHASASVFTSNRCKANPVLWSEEVVKDGVVRAVVLNSGGANCYTGPEGFQTTHAVAEQVAAGLGIGAVDVVVCSTGLIGLANDRDVLLRGVDAAVADLRTDGGVDAATAIMTTDTVCKQVSVERDGWSLGGMAKGAGMLAPQLATMLVVLTTDADVDAATADRALRAATRVSFDRVDSDGCMSTNDTVTLMCAAARPASYRPKPTSHTRSPARAPTSRCSCSPTPKARTTTSRSPCSARPARTTRWKWVARSPAARSSRPRSSARTPTGGGFWPPSVRRAPRSTRRTSTWP
jgi:glutamate N-acetyltransferase/amino-acid N-acetyltransferase